MKSALGDGSARNCAEFCIVAANVLWEQCRINSLDQFVRLGFPKGNKLEEMKVDILRTALV